mmetsp:Transcript_34845/g.86954  ORF Transcript_34845/g.86954 Transcript_34845/m.86954 type:complete len:129 (+) Transcript_34845:79-465(+)
MDSGRRYHLEVDGERFLPVTFLGLPLGERELAEALAILHDALPSRLAAAAHDKGPSAPELLRGETIECVVKLLPAESSYTICRYAANNSYHPLRHIGTRVVCHVELVHCDARGPTTALQRACPGAAIT